MEKVGGDFFDIIELDKKQVGIFFADVTGHGVPAAFITAIMKSALSIGWKNHSKEESNWLKDPTTAFLKINEIFLEYCQNHFISAIYGVYNKEQEF
jgi:serine phosphatase RsbU (regulator of sigma subunit)